MEKNFGVTFTFVFFILGMFPVIYGNMPNLYLIFISIFFLTFTIFFPAKLFIVSKIWLNFGKRLSYLTSPIIMILTYCISVASIGLVMRMLRVDLLDLRFDHNKKSYWKNSEKFDTSLDNQF